MYKLFSILLYYKAHLRNVHAAKMTKLSLETCDTATVPHGLRGAWVSFSSPGLFICSDCMFCFWLWACISIQTFFSIKTFSLLIPVLVSVYQSIHKKFPFAYIDKDKRIDHWPSALWCLPLCKCCTIPLPVKSNFLETSVGMVFKLNSSEQGRF